MTNLSLSQAIRLGAAMKPQGFGNYFDKDGGTCVMGAALDAVGELKQTVVGNAFEFYSMFPINKVKVGTCPGGCKYRPIAGDDLHGYLWHLNDAHRWTREQVADWVEMIEFHEAANSAKLEASPDEEDDQDLPIAAVSSVEAFA